MIGFKLALFLAFATLSLAVKLVRNANHEIPIVRQENTQLKGGIHTYLYETGNGIYEDQQGFSKGPQLQAVQGQFQFQSPEGVNVRITYIADENGYQPQSEHLPTPPPIPPAIQRALDYLATTIPPEKNYL